MHLVGEANSSSARWYQSRIVDHISKFLVSFQPLDFLG